MSQNTSAASTSAAPLTPAQQQQHIQQQQAALLASLPAVRNATLPYNLLNEILQGFETPTSALQPQPLTTSAAASTASVVAGTAAAAGTTPGTSFLELLSSASGHTTFQAQQQQQQQQMQQQQQQHQQLVPVSSSHNHHHNHHQHHVPASASGMMSAATAAANLATLNNQEFLVNLNSYSNDGFGENIGNGTANLYIIRTPLARWNEECTVLDSHSMHLAILLNKPHIMEALEAHRNDELAEKRERRLKEDKEKEKEREKQQQLRQQQQQQQRAAALAAATAASAAVAAAAAAATAPPVTSTVPATAQQQQQQAQNVEAATATAARSSATATSPATTATMPVVVLPQQPSNFFFFVVKSLSCHISNSRVEKRLIDQQLLKNNLNSTSTEYVTEFEYQTSIFFTAKSNRIWFKIEFFLSTQFSTRFGFSNRFDFPIDYLIRVSKSNKVVILRLPTLPIHNRKILEKSFISS